MLNVETRPLSPSLRPDPLVLLDDENNMNRLVLNTLVWLLSIFVASCAMCPSLKPVTNPTMRLEGVGFSALPPNGKDWYLYEQWTHAPYSYYFLKYEPKKQRPLQSFVTQVECIMSDVDKGSSPAEFRKAIERFLVNLNTTDRIHVVSIDVRFFGPQESYCALYDFVFEEKNNPHATDTVLVGYQHGFMCLQSISPKLIIHAAYSERRPQNESSILDETLKREVEDFLGNVVYLPFFKQYAEEKRDRP